MTVPANIAVGVSGGGRSLENLLQKSEGQGWQVKAVVSSSPTCGAIHIAENAGLPVFIGDFSKAQLSVTASQLAEFLAAHRIEWIVLAGFLKLFPALPSYHNRVINIHPALLPRYGGKGMHGLHVHQAVLENKDPVSGATVHYVNERYDEGRIIANAKVSIEGQNSAEGIAKKVFAAECLLLPATLTRLVSGELPLGPDQIWTMP